MLSQYQLVQSHQSRIDLLIANVQLTVQQIDKLQAFYAKVQQKPDSDYLREQDRKLITQREFYAYMPGVISRFTQSLEEKVQMILKDKDLTKERFERLKVIIKGKVQLVVKRSTDSPVKLPTISPVSRRKSIRL